MLWNGGPLSSDHPKKIVVKRLFFRIECSILIYHVKMSLPNYEYLYYLAVFVLRNVQFLDKINLHKNEQFISMIPKYLEKNTVGIVLLESYFVNCCNLIQVSLRF